MSQFNISKRLAQVKPGTIHAGVDLALDKNVVGVINEKAQYLDRFSFPNNRSGYEFFYQRLEELRQKQQASQVVVAMEPTNYFWKLLANYLEEKQVSYHLVNAFTVKRYREGNQLDRSKDDRRDAAQIAELSRNGNYTQTYLQKGSYEELHQLVTLYAQLQKNIRREKQVLWALVGQAFPELWQVFRERNGAMLETLLLTCAPAALIRQMSLDDFIAQLRDAHSGKRLLRKKLAQLHQLAETSVGLTEGLSALQLAIRTHLKLLQTLQPQLETVVTNMIAELTCLPEAQYLLSIPTLKELSAAIFIAEVGDPSRYHSASEWVKLAGIQPAPNSSGKKQRSPTPMSHQGRPRLRSLLYFICLRLIQYDTYFAKLYRYLQIRKENPLTKMQAIGVLMNKLLHICWGLIHNQTFYNPSFAQSI
jgi:transposase